MLLFTGLEASSSFCNSKNSLYMGFYKQHHIGDLKIVGTLGTGILLEEFRTVCWQRGFHGYRVIL